mmetsp:Transcript_22571/g.41990  ORF Transcript_22571/g.41990 Transcript_22571/m.41990 type:complete len:366 (-) Transcript_22571:797-1894(-)
MLLALVNDLLSWCLGIPDRLFPLLNSFPGGPKFFSQGYGNPKIFFDRRSYILDSLRDETYDFQMKGFELDETQADSKIVMSKGKFLSPVANLLPKEAQTCHFQLIEPVEDAKKEVYVIMFPSTGEMGGGSRRAMAKRLAQKYGWCTIILTAPFYGWRKPAAQKAFFIDRVTDILLQSEAVIEEGMLLTRWILQKDPSALVGHTGFSYGAAMASCTSAISLAAGMDGSRIACMPYVGSASPNVLADGVLESGIDWKALTYSADEPYATTRKRLYDIFDETQLRVLAKHEHGKIAVASGVSFSSDGFIQPKYSMALKSQLAAVTSSPPKLRWLPGGHAFAALVRPVVQTQLLEETMQELIQSKKAMD